MSGTGTVDVIDLINPIFYSFWLSDKSRCVLHGGRSSMKSSAISLKLVVDFLLEPDGNVICLRKIGKYLSMSVYEQIKWAIYTLGIEGEFFFGRSPLMIRHERTGTAFYFFGVDDPQKLKSMNIAKGHVMALWYEELAEFAGVEDIDVVEDTFIRQDLGEGKEVKVYYSYNPPRNPYAWVNEWKDSKMEDDDFFIHSSTYMDDEKGFLSAQMIRKIEKYRENDVDYWRWMYKGEVIGLGDTVYNMEHFHVVDKIPDDERMILIDIAADTGHQVSATSFLAFGLARSGNVYLLDTYYYSPANKAVKKAPSELSADYKKWYDEIVDKWQLPVDNQTIDSAEGALRNQVYLDHGIRFHPVAKKKNIDMIDFVQDLLAQGRVHILDTPANQIVLDEHRKYQWDEKTIHSDDPKVIKVDDHSVDAFKYYVVDNARKLGLKY